MNVKVKVMIKARAPLHQSCLLPHRVSPLWSQTKAHIRNSVASASAGSATPHGLEIPTVGRIIIPLDLVSRELDLSPMRPDRLLLYRDSRVNTAPQGLVEGDYFCGRFG